jgi:S1-C subfamily serine protease
VQLADGRRAEATVIGTDEPTDLAVLKIDLPQLPVMTLGRSDRIDVGDYVLAIGNPFGLSQTVTHGIVSAKGRALLGAVANFESFIQTDAAINAGNSGGALVNIRGELIGINTAEVKDADGIGLAIPVEMVRGVMTEILQRGHVVRGWIGWLVRQNTEEESRAMQLPYMGLIVINLAPNSPARQPGGLVIGDKIETIDGQPVQTTQDVASRVAIHKPGTKVTITGLRADRQPFSAEITVIEEPTEQ